jgi:hypothetical protein
MKKEIVDVAEVVEKKKAGKTPIEKALIKWVKAIYYDPASFSIDELDYTIHYDECNTNSSSENWQYFWQLPCHKLFRSCLKDPLLAASIKRIKQKPEPEPEPEPEPKSNNLFTNEFIRTYLMYMWIFGM